MSIKLNVGGTIFETTDTTLKKINYFKYLFEDTNITINDIPFVDRPAHIFKHVLAYAIDDTYNYPLKYKNELDFYDVKYNVKNLYDPNLSIIECKKNITKHIDKLYIELKQEIRDLNDKICESQNNETYTEEYCNWDNCSKSSLFNNYCKEHVHKCDYLIKYIRYCGPNYCEHYASNFNDGHYRCDEHL